MKINNQILDIVEGLRLETLEFLQQLVRIPTLAGNEKPAQDVVIAKLQSMDLVTDVWVIPEGELVRHPAYVPVDISYENRPNVVGIIRGAGGGRSLILNGHIDVVPTGEENHWSDSPWGAKFVNGNVYGRGSADMKAGLVAAVMTLKTLQKAGVKLKGDLILESVVDEETGGNGTLGCILRGYKGDGMIFTEPSGLGSIAVSNRGAQYFRVTVLGQEGCIEYKHDLVNPINKAMEVIQAIDSYSIMRESTVSHPYYDDYYNTKVPLGVCTIAGGDWPSTIPAQCVLEGSIECLPREDIQKVKDEFKDFLDKFSAKDSWLKDHPLKVEWFGLWFEASEIAVDHPLPATLAQTINTLLGNTPIIAGAGGCDLRLPNLYGNTPSVLFGPAGGMIHSVDEYVEFEQVIDCIKVLTHFVIEWCGVKE
jgi:acetylornithine deacetylase